MRILDEVLAYNEQFVKDKKYEEFATSKLPNKRMVILSCMDTRLMELLPHALNVKNGDVNLIKNAGSCHYSSIWKYNEKYIRAIYQLEANEFSSDIMIAELVD